MSVKVDGIEVKKPTILGCGREILMRDGVVGLYRGLSCSFLSIVPYVGFKMAAFDILRTFFKIDNSHKNA
jgi:hypothetical protein